MKKNIILIDASLTLFKSIYESKEVNIELLITDNNNAEIEKLKKLYNVKNIIATDELNKYVAGQISDIDYEAIDGFKASQLNSEHFYARFSDDTTLVQYYYLTALSFWIRIFSKNDISAVLLNGLEHSANFDSLVLDVAKSYNIPGYVIDFHMRREEKGETIAVRSVLNYNLKERISLNLYKLNLKSIEINNYLFYLDKIGEKSQTAKRTSIKGTINAFLPSYTYVSMIALVNIIRNRPICMHNLNTRPSKVLENIIYVKKMRRLYSSISVDFDASSKYVFYALHFEPEASIMSRARFNNQLIIIKQLSQNLPKGWVLYVKEHPNQFKMSKPGWWYYFISIHKYRTKEFYKEVLKLKNVKFLKYSTKSQDIIKGAEAVSTINGTIASEALIFKKPLIFFGHQSTPFGLCKETFKITSSKQCKEAMDQIDGGFYPDYLDFNNIVDKYLFELKEAVPNDVQLLVDYLVCEHGLSDKTGS